ncbi:SUMF1/EgtB/PvdO family nonheme iron enzyme [bacterium]|nr:SUMF1/EgtB/PvdO family nonheme iron enzyme [bacterium]
MAFRHASDKTYPCPICGKENTPHETFRCRRCGRQYLCVEHLDPVERVCEECVSIKKKEITGEPGMVTVHEGEFFIGLDGDDENLDAAPLHEIRLEQYLIDKDLVTNGEFKKFKPEHTYPEGMDDEPVVNVNFNDAKAYAESQGKRLPTEPEWEKAARARDKRVYPWGRDLPEKAIKEADGNVRKGLKKYNLSPYRVRDMVGGPWEWIDSDYEPYPHGNTAISGYYQGNKVIRGGETGIGQPAKTFERRFAHPMDAREDISFRCVKGAPQEYDPIYAGTDIRRTKRNDSHDAPPPEFKRFHEADDKVHTLEHLDYEGVTVKDAIKQATERVKKVEENKAEDGKGAKASADKKAPPTSGKSAGEWTPAPAKSGLSTGVLIGIIIVVIVVAGFFIMKGRQPTSDEPVSPQIFQTPVTSVVRLTSGNVVGPTRINANIGDRISITVQGWMKKDDEVPPLMVMIGDGAEIPVGAQKTFIAEQAGEIKLVYREDSVIPPSARESFLVEIKVEKKK